MTITEALETQRGAQGRGGNLDVQLACSFTPLHLKTLLAGHLQKRVSKERVQILEGTFGDLAGTLEGTTASAMAVAMEWRDLDPRLQYREGAAWGRDLETDLLATAGMMLGRLERAVKKLPAHVRVAFCLPALPLVPAFTQPTWQAGHLQLLLERELLDFASRVAERANLVVIDTHELEERSPRAGRFDLKSELLIGFPYTLTHADALAEALAKALKPAAPVKGVITDLDNTFWSGLVGEVGAAAVRWDPASRYYLHGLYQKLLAALADDGVLVGVASKNDRGVVDQALERQDLLMPAEKMFPIEVHWSPKSESVARILQKWNISADSVIFVDDTPLELAEVEAAHPGITCLAFPAGDYQGVWKLLGQLRDLCGKSMLSAEDALRRESLRQGEAFQEQAAEATGDEFLGTVKAVVTFDFDASGATPRTLELVNKTNQFNLNGERLSEGEWAGRLAQAGAFLASVKYEDRFGALGTIAVVQGRKEAAGLLRIETWVMSCRAFSRRIEQQTVRMLFERFGVGCIRCAFAATAKNGPLQDFFAGILGTTPVSTFEFTKEQFDVSCPALYARVEETAGAMFHG